MVGSNFNTMSRDLKGLPTDLVPQKSSRVSAFLRALQQPRKLARLSTVGLDVCQGGENVHRGLPSGRGCARWCCGLQATTWSCTGGAGATSSSRSPFRGRRTELESQLQRAKKHVKCKMDWRPLLRPGRQPRAAPRGIRAQGPRACGPARVADGSGALRGAPLHAEPQQDSRWAPGAGVGRCVARPGPAAVLSPCRCPHSVRLFRGRPLVIFPLAPMRLIYIDQPNSKNFCGPAPVRRRLRPCACWLMATRVGGTAPSASPCLHASLTCHFTKLKTGACSELVLL